MEEYDVISKSQLKREHHALQALGAKLVKYSEAQLGKLPLDERAREAIADAVRLKHGALQRQLRHLAHVLEEQDLDALRQAVAALEAPTQQASRRFHELERWRASLLRDSEATLARLLAQCPYVERSQILQLIAAAKSPVPREATQGARTLFKYLSENLK